MGGPLDRAMNVLYYDIYNFWRELVQDDKILPSQPRNGRGEIGDSAIYNFF
jgi:hypothetical protein